MRGITMTELRLIENHSYILSLWETSQYKLRSFSDTLKRKSQAANKYQKLRACLKQLMGNHLTLSKPTNTNKMKIMSHKFCTSPPLKSA